MAGTTDSEFKMLSTFCFQRTSEFQSTMHDIWRWHPLKTVITRNSLLRPNIALPDLSHLDFSTSASVQITQIIVLSRGLLANFRPILSSMVFKFLEKKLGSALAAAASNFQLWWQFTCLPSHTVGLFFRRETIHRQCEDVSLLLDQEYLPSLGSRISTGVVLYNFLQISHLAVY